MTPAQSRAARALLNWSQEQLAAASGVSVTSIRNFERGASEPMRNNLAALRRALEEAGVIFIGQGEGAGYGVRLKEVDWAAIAIEYEPHLLHAIQANSFAEIGSQAAAARAKSALPKLVELLQKEKPSNVGAFIWGVVNEGDIY